MRKSLCFNGLFACDTDNLSVSHVIGMSFSGKGGQPPQFDRSRSRVLLKKPRYYFGKYFTGGFSNGDARSDAFMHYKGAEQERR